MTSRKPSTTPSPITPGQKRYWRVWKEQTGPPLTQASHRAAPTSTRATEVIECGDVEKAIDDAFTYHPWTEEQLAKGVEVRTALATAVKVIVANVPPSPDRTTAIRKIREARMDANSAITHGGKY